MFIDSVSSSVPAWPRPGTVVLVPVFGLFDHTGIVSDRRYGGKPLVISNSSRSGGVAEEPWDTFAQGGDVSLVGYPGRLPWNVVLHRARSFIGSRYGLMSWNCEHFVRFAHGLKPWSPQVAVTMGIVFLAGIGLAAARR